MPKDSYLLSILVPTRNRIDYAFETSRQILLIKYGLSLWFYSSSLFEKQLIMVPLKKVFSSFKNQ